MSPKRRVLILCTGNSCRSQMAEYLWRELGGDAWEAFSAGTAPTGYVHPGAISALAELNIDASTAQSKSLDSLADERFDLVISVCDHAAESCPTFDGGGQRLHWPFDDPAAAPGGESAQQAVFRRVRDEIRTRIQTYLKNDAAQ